MDKPKIQFHKLTPRSDKMTDTYSRALDFVFQKNGNDNEDNSDITNIAISGSYGSGKSSIIESYKKINGKNLKFIHISLARFNDANIETPKQSNSSEQEAEKPSKDPIAPPVIINTNAKDSVSISDINILEGKIINQLIHQIPQKRIKETSFAIKRKVSLPTVIKWTIPIFIAISLLMVFINYDWLYVRYTQPSSGNPFDFVYWLASDAGVVTCSIIFLLALAWILFLSIKRHMHRPLIKKLNIQGNEIELFSECNDSFFDKYLNEVIYIFRESGADAVVFEDIDRYDDVKIFQRLREINGLVNAREEKKYKKLKFFYLVRDDIFQSKERAKFFDFIIPVVPVVDSSNSFEVMKNLLSKSAGNVAFDDFFLENLSRYVDDMRLVTNICNEFLIYSKSLSKQNPDPNVMFAIITYKNIFPKDFADFQLNRGFVHTLIQSKNRLIEQTEKQLTEDISKLAANVALAKNEVADSIEELNAIYTKRKNTKGYRGDFIPEEIRSIPSLNIYENEYDIRAGSISKGSRANYIATLEDDVNKLNHKLRDLENYSFKEVLQILEVQDVFKNHCYENELDKKDHFETVKTSPYFDLLKFLVMEGKLSEYSSDYMTYFHEGRNTLKDKTFLMNVTSRNKNDYAYKLDEPEKVAAKLNIVQFDQTEILNFDLLEFLLTNNNKEKLERLIRQLKRTDNYEFASEFFETGRSRNEFLIAINQYWSDFFARIVGGRFTAQQVHRFSVYTVCYCDFEDIAAVNGDNSVLTNYISNKSDYLNISDEIDMDELIKGLIEIEVSFVEIEPGVSNADLLGKVYENNIYELNRNNISMMIRLYYGEYTDEEINRRNYSIVVGKPDSPLAIYINNNISKYMDDIVLDDIDAICDDEEVALSLLNNTELSNEQKLIYIDRLTTKISQISDLSNIELYDSLFQTKKVKYNFFNIMCYYFEKNMNDTLIEFINGNDKCIEFSSGDTDGLSEDDKNKLSRAIVSCMSLSDTKYRELLVGLEVKYTHFNVPNIEESKMEILINEKIIAFSFDNLNTMRNIDSHMLNLFITSNIEDYASNMTAGYFTSAEFEYVLSQQDIDIAYKLALLDLESHPISVVGKEYPDELILRILNDNLVEDEFPQICLNYSSYAKSIRNVIATLAIADSRRSVLEESGLPFELKKDIIENENIDLNDKTDILMMCIKSLQIDQISELLGEINNKEMADVINTSEEVVVENNEMNLKILEAFKENNLIAGYRIETEAGVEANHQEDIKEIIAVEPMVQLNQKDEE